MAMLETLGLGSINTGGMLEGTDMLIRIIIISATAGLILRYLIQLKKYDTKVYLHIREGETISDSEDVGRHIIKEGITYFYVYKLKKYLMPIPNEFLSPLRKVLFKKRSVHLYKFGEESFAPSKFTLKKLIPFRKIERPISKTLTPIKPIDFEEVGNFKPIEQTRNMILHSIKLQKDKILVSTIWEKHATTIMIMGAFGLFLIMVLFIMKEMKSVSANFQNIGVMKDASLNFYEGAKILGEAIGKSGNCNPTQYIPAALPPVAS